MPAMTVINSNKINLKATEYLQQEENWAEKQGINWIYQSHKNLTKSV